MTPPDNPHKPGNISQHKKRFSDISDLLDEADFGDNDEANGKPRSKNAKIVSISLASIGLLAALYFGLQHQTDSGPSTEEPVAQTAKPKPEPSPPKAKPKPVAPKPAETKPIEQKEKPKPQKPKPVASEAKAKEVKQTVPKVKPTTPKPKPVPSQPKPKPTSKASSDGVIPGTYFVQIGAFSVKENAEEIHKKLKAKGFNIQIRERPAKINMVLIYAGSYPNNKGNQKLKDELKENGYDSVMEKTSRGNYSYRLGKFRVPKNAEAFKKELLKKGFPTFTRKKKFPGQVYVVRVEEIPNRKMVRSTQEKLEKLGYKNTFAQKYPQA